MKVGAVIVAAGAGKRFGGSVKKQFYYIHKKPVIVWTLHAFERQQKIDELILVVNRDDKQQVYDEIICKYPFSKPAKLVNGGDKRQDSVYKGVKSVSDDIDIILVQDGVRPFVSSELINKVIEAAYDEGAAICAIQENHTAVLSKNGYINEYLDRNSLYKLQTPQGFRKKLILRAMESAYSDNYFGTDDSSLIIRMGEKVKIVMGTADNIKITSKEDIIIAEKILEQAGDKYADRDWL
ncbi:2-C-methyl-D-erythritol 4-phosphate cytidylyltransferase [candidate division KSB1 bacterium]